MLLRPCVRDGHWNRPAFMSTTVDRNVAMGYAAGDGNKMGIVIESQQGMVNRGADISKFSQVRNVWACVRARTMRIRSACVCVARVRVAPIVTCELRSSCALPGVCVVCEQYPHEREILFGPLTGIEVPCACQWQPPTSRFPLSHLPLPTAHLSHFALPT